MTERCDHDWECVHCGERMLPCDYPETHNIAELRRREYLEVATAAMLGLLASKPDNTGYPWTDLADVACDIANALLAEVKKRTSCSVPA